MWGDIFAYVKHLGSLNAECKIPLVFCIDDNSWCLNYLNVTFASQSCFGWCFSNSPVPDAVMKSAGSEPAYSSTTRFIARILKTAG